MAKKTKSKILFVVMDGVGGVDGGKGTELECARIPTLDRLASEGMCGMVWVLGPGFIPGSLSGHLALFGYDPFSVSVPRGVVEVLGSGFPVQPDDLCARANLCTADSSGIIQDRRAERIPTEEARKRLDALQQNLNRLNGVKILYIPGVQHRFSIIFRGAGIKGPVSDTDPGENFTSILRSVPSSSSALYAAEIINRFTDEARKVLQSFPTGNAVILRGIGNLSPIPHFGEQTGLKAGGIASYPMYLGLCRLMGFATHVVPEGAEAEVMETAYPLHDFFYLHFKSPDVYGEDKNFEGKVGAIETIDATLGKILSRMDFDLVVVTADHSTPALLGSHSAHPVPIVFWGKQVGKDFVQHFTEKNCLLGGLGILRGADILPLILSFAGKARKYGA
ncbi:MAG: 2,3-bisphosphoglycerate-independent phosphoglycerate mutase [bacterium JZ-2024 1]